MEGIKYAVDKFAESEAVMYLDGGHGGWLAGLIVVIRLGRL